MMYRPSLQEKRKDLFVIPFFSTRMSWISDGSASSTPQMTRIASVRSCALPLSSSRSSS